MSDDLRLPELFDEAMALDDESRESWLAALAAAEPELAAELAELIEAAATAREPFAGPALQRLELADRGVETIPTQIGPYTVLREIGRGGMGQVFLARQQGEGYERDVAIKLLRPLVAGGEGALVRLHAEARILAGLDHQGIARLLDAGRLDDGSAYLALELVDGKNLLAYARDRKLDLEARLRLFLAILDAVAYAHARLVVHRDLKPANILVDEAGRPRLLDFGISRLLESDDGDDAVTRTELRGFTPAYASPEQLRGERSTVASDIYSLGVILYELLTGARPYGAETGRLGLERATLELEPEPPSRRRQTGGGRRRSDRDGTDPGGVPLGGQLGGDLDAICLKALRKEPDARYSSVEAMKEDLCRALDGRPVEARRGGRTYRLSRLLRRHRVSFAAGAAVFLALALGAAVALEQARIAKHERDGARAAASEAQREATKSQRLVELLVRIIETGSPDEHPGPITGKELLERGTADIESTLADEPDLRAELDSILGRLWFRIDEIDRAAALLEPAVERLEQSLGPRHRATAAAWSRLAAVRRRQGRFDESRALYERAIEVQSEILGPSDDETLESRQNLGNLLKAQGDFEGARSMLEEVCGAYRASGRWETVPAAKAVGNLGLVYQRLERWDDAEAAHLESYRILSEQLGEDTPRAVVSLWNLAELWSRRGENERAIEAIERALAISERAYGPGFAGASVPLNTLGYAHLDAGHLDEARASFERSIAASVRDRGPGHPDAAWPMRGLGFVALAEEDLVGAETAFERARALRAHAYGGDHWEIAQSLEDLADVAERRHDLPAALERRREALRIWRAVGPSGHPSIARAAAHLGRLLCPSLPTAAEGAALLDEALVNDSGLEGEEREAFQVTRAACRTGD